MASGRELDTGERWFRGLLAPLDIVPGLGAAKKFATTGRVTSKVAVFSKIGLKTADLAKVRQSIGNTVQTAKTTGLNRIKQAKQITVDKIRQDVDQFKQIGSSVVGKMDETMVNFGSVLRGEFGLVMEGAGASGSFIRMENTAETSGRTLNNAVGATKGGPPINVPKVSEVSYGEHIKKGFFGRKELKPNIQYTTKDGYKYTTDEFGRITNVEADNLVLKTGERNEGMQRVAGRKDRLPDDDGGHLIGTQFNGPGDIDNLVAQNRQINRSGGEWYKMEQVWANALKENPPKTVSVKINPTYSGTSLRPDKFEVNYKIEGERSVIISIENQAGG